MTNNLERSGKMKLIHYFASNVKRLRIERGFSQEKLSELSGLHRTYISAIECERRNISLDSIEKIALALNIPPYELLKPTD